MKNGAKRPYRCGGPLWWQVAELPPPCLNDVVAIIFGEAALIKSGDEFTVDFAKIADAARGPGAL